jgi:hypothetical protein
MVASKWFLFQKAGTRPNKEATIHKTAINLRARLKQYILFNNNGVIKNLSAGV